MQAKQGSDPTARSLRCAFVAEIMFLVVSAFSLFTEQRAHHLITLHYGLAIFAITVFLWFREERRKSQVLLLRCP